MEEKSRPIFSIFNLLRKAHGLNKERVKFYGLNDLETLTLINIGLMEEPSQKEISEKIRAPKQTINNVIKKLEDDGLISLEKSKKDKRLKILRLTSKGHQTRDKHLKPLIEANYKIYETLGEKKLGDIKKSLELLIIAIRDNYERED